MVKTQSWYHRPIAKGDEKALDRLVDTELRAPTRLAHRVGEALNTRASRERRILRELAAVEIDDNRFEPGERSRLFEGYKSFFGKRGSDHVEMVFDEADRLVSNIPPKFAREVFRRCRNLKDLMHVNDCVSEADRALPEAREITAVLALEEKLGRRLVKKRSTRLQTGIND